MKRVFRTIGLLIAIGGVWSVNGQEVAPGQTAEPVVVDNKPAPTDYVFPAPEKRFKRYVSDLVGPKRLLLTGASAGISQWRDTPEEWGQGAEGYGRRFASSLGRNAVQQTVTYGLDSALQLDTGFQRSRRQGFLPRLKDALVQNVTSRNKSGKRVISVPRFAGVYAGGIVATETWYPDRYSYKDGLRQGTITLVTGFGLNVVREFLIKW